MTNKDAYNKGWDDGAKAAYEHLKMCEEEQEPKGKCMLSQKYRDWLFIQEPKTGHWKPHLIEGKYESIDEDVCSVCGMQIEQNHGEPWSYCPNCGARMESEG